ncbi:hypothetical protein CXG81DRAFT_23370 [Caulochytrium protostelioides]|uniref:Pantoate--beta-alanine ligase n=1 Tax=Caulochytrium protostelioides TaxID=1555241 RepID=A0A4P9XEH9_9FUNG|nr:hypothetical protein CXG81DRAFT_23370 [Caulochytrium protostelioides]|eukprot:RKP03957.1 hypothetical protein CXG81DRAFT_23370 [Caulochytrium protostelioides]
MPFSDSAPSAPTVYSTVAAYRAQRHQWHREGKRVGVVLTMGALHEGHLALVEAAAAENDVVVVSIFVNPSQFAPTEDLDRYPRTFDDDCTTLARQGHTTAVWAPTVAEMYPSGITTDPAQRRGTFVAVHGKSHQLEGAVRPHFFSGVATIVAKLFHILAPTHAYFGQKDAQQCVVLASMVRDLRMDLQLRIVPTHREADGLARSSRNRFLSPEDRRLAPCLYAALAAMQAAWTTAPATAVADLLRHAQTALNAALAQVLPEASQEARRARFTLQYMSVTHPDTLEPLETIEPGVGALASAAVLLGQTRIIDNVLIGLTCDQWCRTD